MSQTTRTPSTKTRELNTMTTAKPVNDSIHIQRQAGNLTQQLFLSPEEITQLNTFYNSSTQKQIQLNPLTIAKQVNDAIEVKRREGNLVTKIYLNKNDLTVLSKMLPNGDSLCGSH